MDDGGMIVAAIALGLVFGWFLAYNYETMQMFR